MLCFDTNLPYLTPVSPLLVHEVWWIILHVGNRAKSDMCLCYSWLESTYYLIYRRCEYKWISQCDIKNAEYVFFVQEMCVWRHNFVSQVRRKIDIFNHRRRDDFLHLTNRHFSKTNKIVWWIRKYSSFQISIGSQFTCGVDKKPWIRSK